MFNKPNPPKSPHGEVQAQALRPTTQPEAARPDLRVTASTLGAGLTMEGSISGEADLAIEGVVRGDIHVSRLMVGERATVWGRIRAEQVEVRGRVIGDIEAPSVRLAASAHVEGDIAHGRLAIDAGAYFEGRCQPLRPSEAATSQRAGTTSAQVVTLDSARG